MTKEVVDKHSGAILFKKDENEAKLEKEIESLKKTITSLEKRIKKLENANKKEES